MTLRSTNPLADPRFSLSLLLCIGILFLSGCATRASQYTTPAMPLPASFKQALPALTPATLIGGPDGAKADRLAAAAAAKKLDAAQLREWWRGLGDPILNDLVDRALANNLDLHIATARIEQGRARAHQAHANELPVVGASYEAVQQRANTSSVGQINTSGSSTYHVLQLSVTAPVDLWGERSGQADSASLQLARMNFLREDTRRTVVANTVGLYVDYLSLNDRIRIARETEKLLRGMLESVHGRMEGGDATMTDYEQQRAAVHSVAATIPVLELQRANAENALALLLGVAPSALVLPNDKGLASVTFPAHLPQIPSELLLNRPDVHAAEMRLHAAHADLEVARARLLPRLDLTAQTGYGSQWLTQMLSPSGFYWNAIANLSATLFDHGARVDDIAFADAVREELVETYVQSMYSAIRETEDALASVRFNSKRLDLQKIASEAAENAWRCSAESYGVGAVDYITLLDTQRTYFSNLDTLESVQHDRMRGLVALYAALGGGTTIDQSNPQADQPADPKLAVAFGNSQQLALKPATALADDGAWAVLLPGMQDQDGTRRVPHDLETRFPEQMNKRRVVLHSYGEAAQGEAVQATWYRVFVSGFASKDEADQFCAALSMQLERCDVMATSAPQFQEGRTRPVTRQAHAE